MNGLRDQEIKGGFCTRVPASFEVGGIGFGAGFGCGLGVGVGRRVPIRSLPGGETLSDGLQTGWNSLFPNARDMGRTLRSLLAKTGVSGLDLGVGCGVGIGYGYGIGILLHPGAWEGLVSRGRRWCRDVSRGRFTFQDRGKGTETSSSEASRIVPKSPSILPAVPEDPTMNRGTRNHLREDQTRHAFEEDQLDLLRTVLRHQSRIDGLEEQVRELREAIAKDPAKSSSSES